MKGLSFWKNDWFVGVAVAVLFLVLNQATAVVAELERWAYDLGVRATTRAPSERAAVIAIDDVSIANIGRWPWPRDVHARMLDPPGRAKAQVAGSTVFFFEPRMASSLAANGNVRLPMEFAIFEPLGKPDQPLPDFVARNALTMIEPGTGEWPLATGTRI